MSMADTRPLWLPCSLLSQQGCSPFWKVLLNVSTLAGFSGTAWRSSSSSSPHFSFFPHSCFFLLHFYFIQFLFFFILIHLYFFLYLSSFSSSCPTCFLLYPPLPLHLLRVPNIEMTMMSNTLSVIWYFHEAGAAYIICFPPVYNPQHILLCLSRLTFPHTNSNFSVLLTSSCSLQ